MSTRDTKELVRQLERLGCEVILTGGGHYRASTPQGPVFFPSTSSDRRGIKNTLSELRRHGVVLPKR